jgi:hypothetical protein
VYKRVASTIHTTGTTSVMSCTDDGGPLCLLYSNFEALLLVLSLNNPTNMIQFLAQKELLDP